MQKAQLVDEQIKKLTINLIDSSSQKVLVFFLSYSITTIDNMKI